MVDWCFQEQDESAGGHGVLGVIGEKDLDFYSAKKGELELVDRVNDPHLGNRLEKFLTVNKGGKKIGLISRGFAKIFSWRPKFKG